MLATVSPFFIDGTAQMYNTTPAKGAQTSRPSVVALLFHEKQQHSSRLLEPRSGPMLLGVPLRYQYRWSCVR